MDKRKFRVAISGLSDKERQVLKSVAWLSQSRPRGYEFVELAGGRGCDILIVDADDAESMKSWRATPISVPTLFVASAEVPAEKTMLRPIIGSRLLATLDEITIKQLHFVPELVIGQDVEANPNDVVKNEGRPRARALVVDDSSTVRKQLEVGLSHFGLSVDFAETGEEALQRLDDFTYDMIFLDVVLPGIDGYSVCKAIKKDPDRKSTPVIMLTGKTSTFDHIKGALAGCDSYLDKPVKNEVFQREVRKYLAAIKARRATQGWPGSTLMPVSE